MVARTGPWSTLPVRRVEAGHPGLDGDRGGDRHRGVPAVRQVLERGWDLGPATVLVGDDGAGKSTLVEGIATAFGMAPEGGSTGSRHRTRRAAARPRQSPARAPMRHADRPSTWRDVPAARPG